MEKEMNLQDMYVDHLKDMYSAEQQVMKALPKMIKTVTSPGLKDALTKHLKETDDQVARIEQIFSTLDASPRGKKCVGIEGLLEEGKEAMALNVASPELMDSALIGGSRKVEHYEILGYKDLIHTAELLGDTKAVDLLTKSLHEEEAADKKLAQLGENMITPATVRELEAA